MSIMSSDVHSTANGLQRRLSHGYRPSVQRYDLESLIKDIKEYFGKSKGITSNEVDTHYLISLANKYVSDPADWFDYFYNDTSKNYTRNSIENINQKANIVRLMELSRWTGHR